MISDIQVINHNYIIRIVVFSVFLFKNLKNNVELYESEVRNFLKNRISADFKIQQFSDISQIDRRDMAIDRILKDDQKSDITSLIVVTIKTSLKEVNIQVDLDNEEKYDLFLMG